MLDNSSKDGLYSGIFGDTPCSEISGNVGDTPCSGIFDEKSCFAISNKKDDNSCSEMSGNVGVAK